jgi:MFS transporter, PAT family, beta-lactamase induction signal transducer AmpG
MASTGIALAGSPALPLGKEAAGTSPWRWVASLYFAEGLPATVLLSLSAIVLKQIGTPNARVAVYVSLLLLPGILRPLWSPLLEMFATKRSIILGTEAAIAIGFCAVSVALLADAPASAFALLFAGIAIAAATHDMAADGLFITSLSPETLVRYVGWLCVPFHAARFLGQGLVVVFAGFLETRTSARCAWGVAFLGLAAVVAGLAWHHSRLLPCAARTPARPESAVEIGSHFLEIARSFFRKRDVFWLVALVVSYRVVEGQLARIMPLFLLDPRDQGGLALGTAEIGVFYGAAGVCAFIAGALLGGALASRLGKRRAIVLLCIAYNLPAVLCTLLAVTQPQSSTIVGFAIATEQVALGIGFVGLKLATLSAAEGPYETAHCAFAGALAGLSAAAAGIVSGTLQTTLGYRGFFALAIVAASLPLFAAYQSSKKGVRA